MNLARIGTGLRVPHPSFAFFAKEGGVVDFGHKAPDLVVKPPIGVFRPGVKPELEDERFMWGRPPPAVRPGKARLLLQENTPRIAQPHTVRRPAMKAYVV